MKEFWKDTTTELGWAVVAAIVFSFVTLMLSEAKHYGRSSLPAIAGGALYVFVGGVLIAIARWVIRDETLGWKRLSAPVFCVVLAASLYTAWPRYVWGSNQYMVDGFAPAILATGVLFLLYAVAIKVGRWVMAGFETKD